ncbi:MAG: tRNA lysidine(34) synthetase TilS [Brevinema sp.]
MSILSIAKEFLAQYPHQKIAVAVSGGSDSICLLHALAKFTNDLMVIHINHGTRPECIDEEMFVRNVCEQLNISCLVMNPEQPLSLSMPNFEQKAREVRYTLLLKAAQKEGINKIVTCHHADDVHETVFLKIFRGMTNVFIPSERSLDQKNINVLRPFLSISKKEICSYLKEYNINYIEDSSNSNPKYLRNFVRHELLPMISKRIPYLNKHLIHFSQERKEQEEFLEQFVKERERDLFPNDLCAVDKLLSEHPYIQRRILQNKCCQIFHTSLSLKQLRNIMRIISNPMTAFALLYEKNNCQFIKEYRTIRFISEKVIENLEKKNILLHNNTSFFVYDWKVVFNRDGLSYHPDDFIYIRSFLENDKISWGQGSKKVRQFLKDKKIPRNDHQKTKVVIKNDQIVGILGSNFVYIDKQHRTSTQGLYFEKIFEVIL